MKMNEQDLLLREGARIVTALGAMLAPLVEVVLHDLTKPKAYITVIANNLSGRKSGDASTEIGLARAGDPDFPEVLQNYPNYFPDGRPAKSTSIGLKDSTGRYVAAICLNMDISMLGAASAALAALTGTTPAPDGIGENLAPRRLGSIRETVQNFAAARNTTPRGLSLDQRQQAMAELSAAGQLDIRNALSEVARCIGVARSTVYTYLPPNRKKR
jgi:predicted transcriptional regulator YheO